MTIFEKSPKNCQISKSPEQNIGRQMVQKVAQMFTNLAALDIMFQSDLHGYRFALKLMIFMFPCYTI